MSKRFGILTVVGLLAAIGAAAEVPQNTGDKSSPKSDLKMLAKQLRPLFEKLDQKVNSEVDEQASSYEVTYRTQKFKIHGIGKSGIISEQTHDEVGPGHQGFVLRIYVQAKGEVNQFVTPQTLREPYWTTELNLTRMTDSDKQLYWSLSYGSRTDEKLLDTIRDAINKLGEQ